MKWFPCFLIFASTLIIPIQSRAELRSPCILTEYEKAMVAELTRIHKDSHLDHAKTKECVILGAHTILIRYEDGHIGLFDTGDAILLDKKQEASSGIKAEDKSRETAIAHTGTEHERELFTALVQIWQSAPSPDDLPPEQLARADALVQELFATTPSNEILLANYNMFGLRGNRYLAMIKDLPSLSPWAEMTFYEGYLDIQASDMRTEDIPTDVEKHAVIQRIMHILETQQSDKPRMFSSAVSEEIRRLDPSAYEAFKQSGMIIEIVSLQAKSPE